MSDFTGADLDHLDQLAAAFTTAGAEIAAKADTLRTKISTAVGAFESTLSNLQHEASALAAQMNDEMAGVTTQANGVAWTGNNRSAFDGDLATFSGVVQSSTAQIDSDIAAIKAQVDTRFNPVLTEFAAALATRSDEVGATTTTMKTAVDTQRANLDQAANVGWTSA